MKPGTKEHDTAMNFSTFATYRAVRDAIVDNGLCKKADTPIISAVLIKTLADAVASMVCEDHDNIQKILMVEEDYDLYDSTRHRIIEEVYATVLQVAQEEAERLDAAWRVYNDDFNSA